MSCVGDKRILRDDHTGFVTTSKELAEEKAEEITDQTGLETKLASHWKTNYIYRGFPCQEQVFTVTVVEA